VVVEKLGDEVGRRLGPCDMLETDGDEKWKSGGIMRPRGVERGEYGGKKIAGRQRAALGRKHAKGVGEGVCLAADISATRAGPDVGPGAFCSARAVAPWRGLSPACLKMGESGQKRVCWETGGVFSGGCPVESRRDCPVELCGGDAAKGGASGKVRASKKKHWSR